MATAKSSEKLTVVRIRESLWNIIFKRSFIIRFIILHVSRLGWQYSDGVAVGDGNQIYVIEFKVRIESFSRSIYINELYDSTCQASQE